MGNAAATEADPEDGSAKDSAATLPQTIQNNPEPSPHPTKLDEQNASPLRGEREKETEKEDSVLSIETVSFSVHDSDIEILDSSDIPHDDQNSNQPFHTASTPQHTEAGDTSNDTDITDGDVDDYDDDSIHEHDVHTDTTSDDEEDDDDDDDHEGLPDITTSPSASTMDNTPNYDFESIFRYDFDGNSARTQSSPARRTNLAKTRHKATYSDSAFERYGNLLSNILLNAFVHQLDMHHHDNDQDTKSVQLLSYNICSIIVEFLEVSVPKSFVIEHGSYYTLYAMNDKQFEKVYKLRTVVGRLPMRNALFAQLAPFVYTGNDVITHCAKYEQQHSKHRQHRKQRYHDSVITFPIKYNMPVFSTNAHQNMHVEDDLRELWKYAANVDIGVDLKQHPVLMIMPPQTPFSIKHTIMKFAFERMHIPAMCVLDRSALIVSLLNELYHGTALVVEISNDITTITPVIEYEIHQNRMQLSTAHTGKRMNEDLNHKMNREKKLLFNIKCKIAESAQSFDRLSKSHTTSSIKHKIDQWLYENGESLFHPAAQSSIIHHKLRTQDFDTFDYNQFMQNTVMDHHNFSNRNNSHQSKQTNKANVLGLHELMVQVVQQFDDDDIKRRLLRNIVIYGSDENGICTAGNARNLEKRLANELRQCTELMDDENENENESSFNIYCLSEKYVEFYYASYVSRFPQFAAHWITKEDYDATSDLRAMCEQKWKIDKAACHKFNHLMTDNFYASLFDTLQSQLSLSSGPVF